MKRIKRVTGGSPGCRNGSRPDQRMRRRNSGENNDFQQQPQPRKQRRKVLSRATLQTRLLFGWPGGVEMQDTKHC